MMKLLTLLLKGVHQLISMQEHNNMDLATLNSKVETLTQAVKELADKEANKPATVLASDLDPVGAALDAATAKIQAVTNAG